MSRRDRGGIDRSGEIAVQPPPSKCAKFLYYTWKLCSVVFSHLVMISLVVAYCILGAVTFEKLESEHEKEVKRNISQIRNNTTLSILGMTKSATYLNQSNWTSEVVYMLKDFESSILLEMKVRGWDGSESLDHVQWTFTGALFYSIIVITTIGYGHIAPKTQTGKVVTIFYAILGIPLMLLCLSNIGDVMASSFRFLYWRVCCYVCTRPPKKRRRNPSTRRSVRGRTGSTRRRKPLERAHSDTDFRYRDSGYSSGRARRQRQLAGLGGRAPRPRSQPPSYMHDRAYNEHADYSPPRNNRSDFRMEHEAEDFPKISLPLQDLAAALEDLDHHQRRHSKSETRCKSLPRPPKSKPDFGSRRIKPNQRYYEVEDDKENDMIKMHDLYDVDYDNFREKQELEERDKSRRKYDHQDSYRDVDYDVEDEDVAFHPPSYQTWDEKRRNRGCSEYYERDTMFDNDRRHGRRARSAAYDLGRRFDDQYDREDRWRDRDDRMRERDDRWRDVERGARGRRLRRLHTVEDRPVYSDRYSPSPAMDDWSEDETYRKGRSQPRGWSSRQLDVVPVSSEPNVKEEIKPVPIWLCVFLVASYIVLGTFLFKQWEGWPYLDAAYFCFITLTTIGFGDFVPAQGATSGSAGDATAAVHSIALCSLYLLFGIALLAMSFNLVQEEVRANVAGLAIQLGIIKAQKTEDDSDSE